VRARDEAGNVSSGVARLLNYTPASDSILQGQTRIYRYRVPSGQSLQVDLEVQSGDADLYVWSPNSSLSYSNNNESNAETVSITASQTGIYQVEVYGYRAATYSISVSIGGNPAAAPASARGRISQTKTPPTAPLVSVTSSPDPLVGIVPSAPEPVALNNRVYVPLVTK